MEELCCVTTLPHTTPSTTTPVSMSPIPFSVQQFPAPPVTSCDNHCRDLSLFFASHPAGHHVLHPPHSRGGGVILVGARAFQGFLDSYMAPKEAVDVPLLFPFCANCDRQNLARMRPLKGYCICSNIMNAKDRHPKRNPEPKHTHITMEFSTKFNNKYWYLYLRLVTKT